MERKRVLFPETTSERTNELAAAGEQSSGNGELRWQKLAAWWRRFGSRSGEMERRQRGIYRQHLASVLEGD